MAGELRITVGQYSDRGRKEANQDFHGLCIPDEPLRSAKGVAVALADGISSSQVSQVASESAVKSFLMDYYCTSEAWSVKASAQRVLTAINSWLHSQTQRSQYRYDKDRGYVCTFSALIFKSATAHVFHVGDARIYRLREGALEQLTEDHRHFISAEKSYLSRALGAEGRLEIDYLGLPLEVGDVFIAATDGVYEYVDPKFVIATVLAGGGDLDAVARQIAEEAHRRASPDNLTIQIIRIESLADPQASEVQQRISELPCPPILEARMELDGYRIVRELHASSRSHIYLATDPETQGPVVLKIPSIDLRGDPAYLERFMMEEWAARRINSAHVAKPCALTRKRTYLYVVMEYVDGRTLAQWMRDNPRPDLETVRRIVEQVAKGLQAFHRAEMLHQDLRPENILIDATDTVKIIDFGSTRVAGIFDGDASGLPNDILGTAQYTAPEYFLGEGGSHRSDLFSLGVITYQMLSGRLPYGTRVASARTKSAQRKLVYDSVLDENREIPAWINGVLKKAVHPDPARRYQELSEFIYDLRHPNKDLLRETRTPLIERNPVVFWKTVSAVLAILLILVMAAQVTLRD